MNAEIFAGISRNDQLVISPIITAHRCGKINCFFCERMIGIRQSYTKPYIKPPMPEKTRKAFKPWIASEDAILLNGNMDNHFIEVPNRTKGAIKNRKCVLRKLHGIIAKPRVYNQWGFC